MPRFPEDGKASVTCGLAIMMQNKTTRESEVLIVLVSVSSWALKAKFYFTFYIFKNGAVHLDDRDVVACIQFPLLRVREGSIRLFLLVFFLT